jgi:1-deoxy-D-xylulose-5-phosphate reductoisomerase
MIKKKIVILGSTGSIGKNLLKIIKNDKKNFNIFLLSANKNTSLLIKQAKEFNVKNIIISNQKSYLIAKKKLRNKKINIYNSLSALNKILNKKKIYYSMVAIVGLDGLGPCLNLIKYSKNIAVANKESLICGWALIKKSLKKYRVNFIPVDSEHFSIYSLIDNQNYKSIDKIFITASGGPFFKSNNINLKKIKISDALNHPNWKMGKKISIDSSTMMNKVFEVIEAKNIFNLKYNNIKILIHPKSYVHTILKLTNGLIKMLVHDPNMKIPIFNSLYLNQNKKIISKNLDLSLLNDLELSIPSIKQFPLIKILSHLPEFNSLYETALITINDFFVYKFLEKKITYFLLISNIYKFSKLPDFYKFTKIPVKNISDINKTRNYVSSKLRTISI